MNDDNTPPAEPKSTPVVHDPDDLDVISEARDDIKKVTKGRDSKGRLVKGHKALPSAGRPVEIAHKARRSLMRSEAMTKLTEIAAGTRLANPGQIEAIKLLMDRGYGKVVDVQTHLHLMAGASTQEQGGLSVLSADALTALARTLSLPSTTTTTTTPVREDVVEGELVTGE